MIWISNYGLFKPFISLIQHLLRKRQKNVHNFVGFLEYGRTWYFAFGIYWPLNRSARGDVPQTIYQYTIFFFSLRRSIMQTVYYLTRKRGQYTTNTVPWGFIWLNSLVKISLIRLWLCNQNGSNVASCQSFVSLAVASVSHALLILHNYCYGV